VSFTFDLIHGSANPSPQTPDFPVAQVLDFVSQHAAPEVLSLYNLALEDPKACAIVRAKSPIDGSLVGTVIVCRSDTNLARWMPLLTSAHDDKEMAGGILAPITPQGSAQREIVLQGLVTLGIKQIKKQGAGKGILNWVAGDDRDVLLGMGFDVLEAWEEVTCGPERWSEMNLG